MSSTPHTPGFAGKNRGGWLLLVTGLMLTIAVYASGLSGSYLFDDYPNIVDNTGVQPGDASVASLIRAAVSSPSSEFKRPLASLSFAANYLATGLDPYWMKLTNLAIHLLNGLLVFLLARSLLRSAPMGTSSAHEPAAEFPAGRTQEADRCGIVAALLAAGWMLLPVNLTGVLYVVQRMESMANLFVLLGLFGYVAGRRRMLVDIASRSAAESAIPLRNRGFILCIASIIIPTSLGILAKETAVMLPLYAVLVEWIVFRFATPATSQNAPGTQALDRRLVAMFLIVLVVPMIAGLTLVVPSLMHHETWATRDFTVFTRLLSEARIIVDYIAWTLLPTPDALSFYHDDFRISTGLLTPWTTLASVLFLGLLTGLMVWLRRRQPLAALGIALFLGCQLLTGTILPLELIYEHRNYFASFGLLLAVVPLLAAPRSAFLALPRYALLAGLMLCWTGLTALTAYSWGNPLRLAADLASRASNSPRAQYELGRTYIIYSHYDPSSPFTKLAYAPLEKSAALPNSSILPEQALIFMNSRMHLPTKDAWWDSLITKLKLHAPGVQDESSLTALTKCAGEGKCALPKQPMIEAYLAALSHPNPSARLLAGYSDYAWNVLNDRTLGVRMASEAVKADPGEPAYRITLIRMLAATGQKAEIDEQMAQLEQMNFGGRLNGDISRLKMLPNAQ